MNNDQSLTVFSQCSSLFRRIAVHQRLRRLLRRRLLRRLRLRRPQKRRRRRPHCVIFLKGIFLTILLAILAQVLGLQALQLPHHLAINLSYLVLAFANLFFACNLLHIVQPVHAPGPAPSGIASASVSAGNKMKALKKSIHTRNATIIQLNQPSKHPHMT